VRAIPGSGHCPPPARTPGIDYLSFL
jgi:hypothetical protein